MSPTPRRTAELLARDLGGKCRAAELITWAVEALSDGFDTESLRRLAGMDLGNPRHELSAFEASQVFRTAPALREIGLGIPSLEEALRAYAKSLAADLWNGNLTPQNAIERMHRDVLGPLSHPRDLMAWCYLWEGLDPVTLRPLSPNELEQAIRTEARSLLGTGPPF
jgi:hypothetical protein